MRSIAARDVEQIVRLSASSGWIDRRRRPLLLHGLSPSIVSAMPDCRTPREQIACDLRVLEQFSTVDSSAPLCTYLDNAVMLASIEGRAESSKLCELLLRVRERLEIDAVPPGRTTSIEAGRSMRQFERTAALPVAGLAGGLLLASSLGGAASLVAGLAGLLVGMFAAKKGEKE